MMQVQALPLPPYEPTGISSVPIAALRRDGGTQPRDHVSKEIAQEYAEAIIDGAQMPPVTVFFDGTDHWLADGFHRVLAHEIVERKSVAADVRQGTRRDAVLFSSGANADHGYRRSQADKRRAVLTLLNDPEWSSWSDREIARRCRVDGKTVAVLRPKEVTAEIRSEPTRTYQDRHGNTSTMRVAAIGPAVAPDKPKLPLVAGRTPDRRPDSRNMPRAGQCMINTASTITGFSAERLAAFARAGEIEGAVKDGGAWLFDVAGLRAWMKGKPAIASVEPAPEPESIDEPRLALPTPALAPSAR